MRAPKTAICRLCPDPWSSSACTLSSTMRSRERIWSFVAATSGSLTQSAQGAEQFAVIADELGERVGPHPRLAFVCPTLAPRVMRAERSAAHTVAVDADHVPALHDACPVQV